MLKGTGDTKKEKVESEKPSIKFFSEFGYVKVEKEEYEKPDNLVQLSNSSKLTGRINKCHLTKEIKVNVKTLYGERKMHTYKVQIDDKISSLIGSLLEEEERAGEKDAKKRWHKNYQYRLISTVGSIRELPQGSKFEDENIKSGQTIILASPVKLNFSETQHGPGILIENNNSTAFKQNGDEHQYALTDKGYSSGTNYIEFTLETEPDEKNIIIGITQARNDYYFNPDCKNFWGYIPSDCKKTFNENGSLKTCDYGDICKMGDKIGVLLEFNSKGLDVSFFINKMDLGLAFKGLPLDTYYPCCLLYYEGAKVKVTNRVPLPDVACDKN